MEKIIIHNESREIKLSDEEAKDICHLGEGEKCCAFLVMNCNPAGFKCIRMSYPTNSSIFPRLKEGTMGAKGEGGWEGCPWTEELGKGESHD